MKIAIFSIQNIFEIIFFDFEIIFGTFWHFEIQSGSDWRWNKTETDCLFIKSSHFKGFSPILNCSFVLPLSRSSSRLLVKIFTAWKQGILYGIPLDWAPLSLQLTYLHVMILISVLSHNLQFTVQNKMVTQIPFRMSSLRTILDLWLWIWSTPVQITLVDWGEENIHFSFLNFCTKIFFYFLVF